MKREDVKREVAKTDEEWRAGLTSQEFDVLRCSATERYSV